MPGAHILPRPADTTADAEQVQIDLLRAASAERRLRLAFGLSAMVIGAARRAIAASRPAASRRTVDLLFVELHYGAELAAAVRAELDRRDRADPAPP